LAPDRKAVGDCSARDVVVFIKQYGEARSGTNWLRTLLQQNYANVVVLMHVLGDKHSAPVDIEDVLLRTVSEPDPDLAFVCAATLAAPAETTNLRDSGQSEYLRRLASPLAEAVRSGRLCYAVSVKHPFAQAASWLRWLRLQSRPLDIVAEVRRLRVQANRRLHRWLELAEAADGRSIIVRYEDLLGDTGHMLDGIAFRFGLQQATSTQLLFRKEAAPAHWDDREPPRHWVDFDAQRHAGSPATSLAVDVRHAVDECTDWTLLERVGYHADRDAEEVRRRQTT
jgi:hypothetical protein